MREVKRVDQGLPDVRVDLTGQRRQPRLDRIDPFSYRREAEPVDDPLDPPDLVFDAGAITIADSDCRGQVAERDMVAAQDLKCEVGIDHLVVGVGVEQL